MSNVCSGFFSSGFVVPEEDVPEEGVLGVGSTTLVAQPLNT